MNLNIIQLD